MTKKKYKRYCPEFKHHVLKRASEDGVTDKGVCEELGIDDLLTPASQRQSKGSRADAKVSHPIARRYPGEQEFVELAVVSNRLPRDFDIADPCVFSIRCFVHVNSSVFATAKYEAARCAKIEEQCDR